MHDNHTPSVTGADLLAGKHPPMRLKMRLNIKPGAAPQGRAETRFETLLRSHQQKILQALERDAGFRQELLSNPVAALARAGVKLPDAALRTLARVHETAARTATLAPAVDLAEMSVVVNQLPLDLPVAEPFGGVTTNTFGYDLFLQLTLEAINKGLAFLPGGGVTPALVRAVDIELTYVDVGNITKKIPVPYLANLRLQQPRVAFEGQEITVTYDLAPESKLTLMHTPTSVLNILNLYSTLPLAGTVEFRCPLKAGEVSAQSAWGPIPGHAASAQLTEASSTTIDLDDQIENQTIGSSLIGTAAPTVPTLAAALSTMVGDFGDAIGDLPLTRPIPVGVGDPPTAYLRELGARILSTSTLGIGLQSYSSSHEPQLDQATAWPDLDGDDILLRLSKVYLVRFICEIIERAEGFGDVTFQIFPEEPAGRFEGSVSVNPAGGKRFKLKKLTVGVADDGRISISGRGKMEEDCYETTFTFSLKVDITCAPESGLTITASEPSVDSDTDIDLWCSITTGAIVGVIVDSLTGLVTGILFAVIAWLLINELEWWEPLGAPIPVPAIGNAVRAVGLPLPVPMGSDGIAVSECDIVDALVQGNPIYADMTPRYSAGELELAVGAAADLDGARIASAGSLPVWADLVWTGSQLEAVNGCSLATLPADAAALTYFDLQTLSYGTAAISISEIPEEETGPQAMHGARRRVAQFAARTSEGRIAKCAAWRGRVGLSRGWIGSGDGGVMLPGPSGENGLHLLFETFREPTRTLSLDVRCEMTGYQVVDQGMERCRRTSIAAGELRPGKPTIFGDSRENLLNEIARWTGSGAPPGASPALRAHASHVTAAPSFEDFRPGRMRDECDGSTTLHDDEVAFWAVVERAQRVTIRARADWLAPPVAYRWTVFDTPLEGTGSTTIGGVTVEYSDMPPEVRLEAPNGVDLNGEVELRLTSGDGRTCERRVTLARPGSVRIGGCHQCPAPRTPADFLRHAAIAARFEPRARRAFARLADAVTAAGVAVPAQPRVLLQEAMRRAFDRTSPKRSGGTKPAAGKGKRGQPRGRRGIS